MNLFVKALQDHYVSQLSESVATLNLYLNNSVGIGEHSDILAEVKKYVDILDAADSKLSTLNKYMKYIYKDSTVESPLSSRPTSGSEYWTTLDRQTPQGTTKNE
jgi:hypothetical protein